MENDGTKIILSIETSCDETAVAVLECSGDLEKPVFNVLGNALYSQVDIHKEYGGVYPTMAKREHAKNLVPLLKQVLKETDLEVPSTRSEDIDVVTIQDIFMREPALYEQFIDYISSIEVPNIDAIAVTTGPGLEPALWVGINFAQALAKVWDKPLIPVNHMEGHIVSVLTKDALPHFPALSLLISGNHTELVAINNWFEYKIIGKTRDDAVGEAFDKVARLLGFPYPGGPHISRLAEEGRKKGLHAITLPRPMLHSDDYDFSFSGLKTAVLYLVQKMGELSHEQKTDIAREFEDAVRDVLISKTTHALEEYGATTLIIGGGVSANTYLRHNFQNLMSARGGTLFIPSKDLTGDNAVMIGMAGYMRLISGKEPIPLKARGNLSLEEY